jgi:hypothetical protein
MLTPNPPGGNPDGGVAHNGHGGLQGHHPFELGGIIKEVPSDRAHGAHQGRQHCQREPAPVLVLGHIAIGPDQPNGGDPFNDARNMDHPGRNGKGMHGKVLLGLG